MRIKFLSKLSRKAAVLLATTGVVVSGAILASPASATVSNPACNWAVSAFQAHISQDGGPTYCYTGTGNGYASVIRVNNIYSGQYYAKWNVAGLSGILYTDCLSPYQSDNSWYYAGSFTLSTSPIPGC